MMNESVARVAQEREYIGNSRCSIARTMDLVGDRWTILVLREAYFRVRRFEEFQQNLKIARNILTCRLKHLVLNGIFERVQYLDRPRRFEYHFTEKGLDLYPTILALMVWGDRWLADLDGPPLVLRHIPCEHSLSPRITCSECGLEIKAREVTYAKGEDNHWQKAKNLIKSRRRLYEGDPQEQRTCSVARTVELVGDRWTFLIIREAFFGVRRFEQFQNHLDIARNILTDRLQRLVAHDIFYRSRYQQRPERFEYRLTEKGLDLYPVALTLMNWGDRWLTEEDTPPLLLRHKRCRHEFRPMLTCNSCGGEVKAREVRFR
ncbi:MAG: helix-turn-helix transcriptional regulator [Proteobacteria bacterium]|nr:helix-turn-helix transcriptional regulator [Pseudomonadota bacterium]